jgi:hypothetical protein
MHSRSLAGSSHDLFHHCDDPPLQEGALNLATCAAVDLRVPGVQLLSKLPMRRVCGGVFAGRGVCRGSPLELPVYRVSQPRRPDRMAWHFAEVGSNAMKVVATDKTIWIPALIAIVFGTACYTQTVLTVLLADLSRYLGAATRLTTAAIGGVDRLNPAFVLPEDRQQAQEELRRLSFELSSLRATQRVFVEDLSQYTAAVREGRLSTVDWSSILNSVQRISIVVSTVVEGIERSKWLKVAFNPEDRLALREVLLERQGLLRRLSELPAPRTPQELEQLDRMNQHYRQLIASLNALNIALTRAADRLR